MVYYCYDTGGGRLHVVLMLTSVEGFPLPFLPKAIAYAGIPCEVNHFIKLSCTLTNFFERIQEYLLIFSENLVISYSLGQLYRTLWKGLREGSMNFEFNI